MTAPDRIGPPCEYCQMPQAEDDDGYGHCWTCQNPNCKGLLGYIRELERAAIARATPAPAAMTPEVRALVEAAQEYIEELEWHYGGGATDLTRKYRAALAALRAGGDA